VPIEYVAMDKHGNSGYHIRKDRYFLPEVSLTMEEALVLAVLHRMAVEGGAALGENLLSALQKVSADSPLGEGLQASLAEQHAFFGVRPGRRAPAEHAVLEVLTEAVLAHRRVRFRYYTIGRDAEGDREVEPYGLGYHRGHWYLAARDVAKNGMRVFRTDRIRGGVRAGKRGAFEVPAGFRVTDHVGLAPWEFLQRKPPTAVRIRFEPALAWMVKENLRDGERFEDLDDGGGVLEMKVRDPEAVLRWSLKHGRLARVLAPATLRASAVDAIRRTLAAHDGAPSAPRRAPARRPSRRRDRGRSA
jgi:predicted DNA-binding transcriptional regulator YafY